MLSRWKNERAKHGSHVFPGKGHMHANQAELVQLKVDNKRLRMERDILKKVAAFLDSAHHVPLPSGALLGRPNGSCLLVPRK